MLTTAITDFMTNFGTGLVACAIIFAGLLFMGGRMSFTLATGIVVGALMLGNYQTIEGWFNLGGGP